MAQWKSTLGFNPKNPHSPQKCPSSVGWLGCWQVALNFVTPSMGRAAMTTHTDSSHPHLQYSTSYKPRKINGTQVKVRGSGGRLGQATGASATGFVDTLGLLTVWCGIRFKSCNPFPISIFFAF